MLQEDFQYLFCDICLSQTTIQSLSIQIHIHDHRSMGLDITQGMVLILQICPWKR